MEDLMTALVVVEAEEEPCYFMQKEPSRLMVSLMLLEEMGVLVMIPLGVVKEAVVQVEELFCNQVVLILMVAPEHLLQLEVQVLAAVVLVETEE